MKVFIILPGPNLEICLQQKLYGRKTNLLRKWAIGDRVIYCVDQKIAGIGTVTGAPFYDNEKKVWPDDIYPYRIQVTPDVILASDKWIPITGDVKAKMVQHLTANWILPIRSGHPVPVALGTHLESLISNQDPQLHDRPSDEFKDIQKEAQKQVQKKKAAPSTKPTEKPSGDPLGSAVEEQSHDRTQWYLIKLGRALGCDVWVAKNDRWKSYKGEAFADLCLSKMPSLGFDQDTSKIIENIDVIWLKGSVIQCAFEVEHTTSVYSGLLRLADLVASQPHITIKLFIVAPKERKSKVVYELNRPVFKPLLCEKCKYIPYDKLEITLAKIEDFQGYLQVGLVEKIAESCSSKTKPFD